MSKENISRRKMLFGSAALGSAAVLTACEPLRRAADALSGDTPAVPTAVAKPAASEPVAKPAGDPTVVAAATRYAELQQTPSPVATATGVSTPRVDAAPTARALEAVKKLDAASFVEDVSRGAWAIKGTSRLKENPIVATWLKRLQNPEPAKWKTFPNIPNPDEPNFPVRPGTTEVPMGVEYGVPNVPFMYTQRGDIIVPARHYRLITADYDTLFGTHKANKETGGLLLLFNVGGESVKFENQHVDNGFTVPGRYWDGDNLEWAVKGLVSHAAANMLGMETHSKMGEILNAGRGTNAGANCGIPEACKAVDVNVVILAGDAVIAQARTLVNKNGVAQAPARS